MLWSRCTLPLRSVLFHVFLPSVVVIKLFLSGRMQSENNVERAQLYMLLYSVFFTRDRGGGGGGGGERERERERIKNKL